MPEVALCLQVIMLSGLGWDLRPAWVLGPQSSV